MARGSRRVEREARGRRGVGRFEFQRSIQRRKLDRLEPLAQHRFERVVPAAVDVERRVEVRGAAEPDARQPVVAVLAVADLGLQRRQRLRARLEIGQRAAFALPRIARFADARLGENAPARLHAEPGRGQAAAYDCLSAHAIG